MVAIGNIERGHLGKLVGDGLHVLVVVDHPELMTESVDGSNEIVLRLGSGISHDQLIEYRIVGIGEEYRLDVGIVHTDMLHAVFFLIATRELVLLDAAGHIVVGMGTYHETVLRLAIHRLRINIIMFARILNEPALILELLEVLSSLFVHTGVVLGGAYGEVDLGLDDVVEALLIIASLCPRLFTVEHIVGTTLHLLHQILRWADSLERFYDSHFTYSPGIWCHHP